MGCLLILALLIAVSTGHPLIALVIAVILIVRR